MSTALSEIEAFVDELLDLDNKAREGQQRLTSLLSGRLGIMRSIKIGVILALQKSRLKKLATMKEELITRSKEENWKNIPGVEEYAGMALSGLSSPIGGIK
ncbi:MAG: hypothetical protein PHC68_07220 [Syntrophorhabdaceae bacterium]|nr:hypothetical protein [Syntrophorhabdaceae bacterium]